MSFKGKGSRKLQNTQKSAAEVLKCFVDSLITAYTMPRNATQWVLELDELELDASLPNYSRLI